MEISIKHTYTIMANKHRVSLLMSMLALSAFRVGDLQKNLPPECDSQTHECNCETLRVGYRAYGDRQKEFFPRQSKTVKQEERCGSRSVYGNINHHELEHKTGKNQLPLKGSTDINDVEVDLEL